MKTKLFSLLALCTFLLAACNKYVDIIPKGKNTLSTINDLDLALNFNWSGAPFNFDDLSLLVNDNYPSGNVVTAANLPVEQQNSLFTYYVPPVRVIPSTDNKYDRLYPLIVPCNVVIKNVPTATGDAVKGAQITAEALVLRAYFHYLIVNIFAKAYNPATAATDGGIPYVTDIQLETPNQKLTVAQVYSNILADINASLDNLPVTPISIMRPGKSFGYALKAKVLLTMRNYADAVTAANTSLSYNSAIEDQTAFIAANVAARVNTAPDNLFYGYYLATRPFGIVPSAEAVSNFETGNIIRYYTNTYVASNAYGVVANYPTGTAAAPVFNGMVLYWSSASYAANTAGITSEDVYLTKAEALAMSGSYSAAMDVLNLIRAKRIRPADYRAATAATEAAAMAGIMKMARTEHLFSYKNFIDFKRWNTFDAYKKTITRKINNLTFSLTPDSPLWIFPFPQSGTLYNPTLTQNF